MDQEAKRLISMRLLFRQIRTAAYIDGEGEAWVGSWGRNSDRAGLGDLLRSAWLFVGVFVAHDHLWVGLALALAVNAILWRSTLVERIH